MVVFLVEAVRVLVEEFVEEAVRPRVRRVDREERAEDDDERGEGIIVVVGGEIASVSTLVVVWSVETVSLSFAVGVVGGGIRTSPSNTDTSKHQNR